jgi:hypothetical protein
MSQNLILGRGKVYFDLFATPTTYTLTGRRYIGNTPEMALDIASTQLAHYGMDSGLKIKDDNVILQLDRKGTFKTDEISNDNMSLFLIGDKSTQVQSSGSGQTTTITGAKLDRFYQLGATTGNPSGARNVTVTTVATTATTPIPLVLNTDYTVDLVLGLIYLVPTSVVVIDGTTNVLVTYAVAAASRDRVVTTATAAVNGALSFIAYNPKGTQRDFFMPYVQITPNGAFAMKGDVWQEVAFNYEVLNYDPTLAHIYMDGRPYTP